MANQRHSRSPPRELSDTILARPLWCSYVGITCNLRAPRRDSLMVTSPVRTLTLCSVEAESVDVIRQERPRRLMCARAYQQRLMFKAPVMVVWTCANDMSW